MQQMQMQPPMGMPPQTPGMNPNQAMMLERMMQMQQHQYPMHHQGMPPGMGKPMGDNGSSAPNGGSVNGSGGPAPHAPEVRSSSTGVTINDQEVKVQDPSGRVMSDYQRFSTFDAAPFPSSIQDELKRAGFPAPSQIQQYCWPLATQNRDVIGVAATGSGKTISFLLPAFSYILNERVSPGDPLLCVIAPTRELAIQIQEESDKFGRSSGIRTVCCYGGAPKGPQASEIRSGVQGVIGTPGRINDFLEAGQLNLDRVCKLVLDEADRMLDMGFEPQIRKILAKIPRNRHTMFFTATWPPSVRRLASEFLNGAYTVTIGNRDELKGNQDITQIIWTCRGSEKNTVLMQVLRTTGVADQGNSTAKGLVFCSTKRMCDQLAQQLERNRVPCSAIHGDKGQRDREAALNGLKEGRLKLLVATDVAARGLDIKGVTLVVNYDPPSQSEDYVHRIGRTGRAGQKGQAVALISERDTHALRGIIQVMKRTNQAVPPELEEMARHAPPPPPSGRAARGGPPPVQIDPNFKPGIVSSQLGEVAATVGNGNAAPAPAMQPFMGSSAPPARERYSDRFGDRMDRGDRFGGDRGRDDGGRRGSPPRNTRRSPSPRRRERRRSPSRRRKRSSSGSRERRHRRSRSARRSKKAAKRRGSSSSSSGSSK